jgi:beta-galactosidase
MDLTLKQGKGRLIVVSTLNEMKNKALAAVKSNKGMPAISIAETNDRNMPGCEWRVIAKDKNRYIVNIVNIGKSDATVRLSSANGNITSVEEVLTGLKSATQIVMKPNNVQLLEVRLE